MKKHLLFIYFCLIATFVFAQPNFRPNSISAPSSIVLGQSVTMQARIQNSGNQSVNVTTVCSIHLSSNTILTPGQQGDRYLAEITIPAIAANTIDGWRSITFNFPCDVAAGSYYIFFSADGGQRVSETSEADNFAYTPVSLTKPNPPINIIGGTTPPGMPLSSLNPTLTWNSPTLYHWFYVSQYPFGSTNLIYNNASCIYANNSFTLPTSLRAGMIYRWNMRTSGGDCFQANCTSDLSNTGYFYVRPDISPNSTQSICNGETVNFSTPAINPASGSTITYQWFKDNNPIPGANSVNYTATTEGIYFVRLTYSGSSVGNASIESNPITVNRRSINASINANRTNICLGESVTLTASGGQNYSWSGLGLSSTSGSQVVATPQNAGNITYTVTVTDNGCTAQANQSINVDDKPSVRFTFTRTANINFQFQNQSTNATNFLWAFGDGNTSNQHSPTHRFASNGGNFRVCLTASNTSCNEQKCENITVVSNHELPQEYNVRMSPNPTSGMLNITLNYPINSVQPSQIFVIDVLGRLSKRFQMVDNNAIYDISDLTNGIYFISILIDGKEYIAGRIIKTQ